MPSFEDMFKGYFDGQNNMPNPFDPDSFSQFIQDSIKNSFPDQAGFTQPGAPGGQGPQYSQNTAPGGGNNQPRRPHPHANNQGIQHNLFETHDHIIVRIASDPRSNPEPPQKLYLNSNELLLKGSDGGQPMFHIHLPKPVSAKHTKVDLRNGVLEVSMLKKSPEPYAEINLADLFSGNTNSLQN